MTEILPLSDYWVVATTIALAYTIFSMAGFGSALIASPIMALYLPVAYIVPLLALLDMSAALINLYRDGRDAEWRELRRLIPMMIFGSLIGAAILFWTQPKILLLALGIFVTTYALYTLSGIKPKQHFTSQAALPFGFVGGIFSALFGSGGFIYAIYLKGRLEQKEVMRITQTTLIGFSTLTRFGLFLLAGIYGNSEILLLTLTLLPAMLLGIFLGRHITLKISPQQFFLVINCLVLISGIMLITRYFSG